MMFLGYGVVDSSPKAWEALRTPKQCSTQAPGFERRIGVSYGEDKRLF